MRASPSVIYVHNAGDVPIALAVRARTGARVVVHLHLPPPIRQPSWRRVDAPFPAAVAPSADTANRWMSGPEWTRLECQSFPPVSTSVASSLFHVKNAWPSELAWTWGKRSPW